MQRESEIEKYLREEVKKLGGKAYKWVSPGNAGVPDRIVVIPKGRVYFVELKREGGVVSPIQQKQITDLSRFGCWVGVIDSKAKVDDFIRNLHCNVL